jgi:lipopolysaccharide biosynthesis regulator YciM
LLITGKVVLEDGTPPAERVAIQRVCNGSNRREGYTDSRGNFQFALGRDSGIMQDATESTLSGRRAETLQSIFAGPAQYSSWIGCELRAIYPGYQSSLLVLNLDRDLQQQVGTIVLHRMGKGEGSTTSVSSMQAPKAARQAYEKGESSLAQRKFSDAEPQLQKAVSIYPQFAAAWCLLGVTHEGEGREQEAIQDYRRSMAADPQFVNPQFALAALAVRAKRWQDAVQATEQVAKMDSAAFPIAYFYNAVANYNLGNLESAEKSVRNFMAMDANHRHPESALLLAEILEQRRDYAGAAEQKRDYLKIAPNAANAESVRADLKRLEDLTAARHN